MSFVIYAEREGNLQIFEAKAVIDATGTWGNPNPAASSGIWHSEERALSGHIYYGIPDIAGKEKERYAKKRTAVIGGDTLQSMRFLNWQNLRNRILKRTSSG